MTDKEDIERLIVTYSYIIDGGEWDRLGDLFTEDGSFAIKDSELSMEGIDDLRRQMSSIKHPLTHYTSNILVDVVEGADTATSRARVFAPRADGTISMGMYNDELIRTPDGWRFKRRFVVNVDRYWRAAPLTAEV